MQEHEKFMRRAIELARASIAAGGGPFGAVVVRGGVVLSEGSNEVVPGRDPTSHAEVVAIRRACAAIDSHVLADCTIYSSCEPCPMCLAAIHWSRIPTIHFGANRHDAADAGFDDALLYRKLLDSESSHGSELLGDEAREVFEVWKSETERTRY